MPIGVDEWAEQAESRTEGATGWIGRGMQLWLSLPPFARLLILTALLAGVPMVTSSDFIVRVGINALLLALLAVGLNVVVGWAGLLDLGFVAFYGFGAYTYALLSSDQLGVHLPTLLAIPIVVVLTALLGLLLGLPSRRLIGDYLAIVTLFFGQIFVELVTNLDRINVPWSDEPFNLTGGPNGIAGIDPFTILGFEFSSPTSYFYLLLAFVAVTVMVLFLLDDSRTGRAWRAVHDDSTAAELLTMPVNRLKLMAFSTSAAIAGLAGSVFASFQLGVFPRNFDVQFLIVIYAALILGGSGSLAGAVAGGLVVTMILDLLRDPAQASVAFYGVIAITLIAKVRPWRNLAVLVVVLIGFGAAVHAIVGAISSDAVGGSLQGADAISTAVESWVVLPTDPQTVGNWAFCLLIVALIAFTQLEGRARMVLLVPLLYLAAFVWENRLVEEPSITRQLLLGASLVVLMNSRPQGLLGKPRVEQL